ncbi:MFS transporter [Novosphingobium pentaromativorans]|uniref:Major facilitator superfamily (MFS) profile domain-containing protein n=1 Tax=Novosphingobium pentaromativorans US6-1 TaxID=1088721 RepID=G6EGG1_9SPHN|nr:MFS transporter [Novosphingobium pentaromativorans]AIT82117.1 hypothetical protein JI59_21535 [Novosphingobium pentaromativorans US6-1]EHJ59612.1 hypothetical protein NSU_3495 [Novosphingobium pentaromativorans US6-1]
MALLTLVHILSYVDRMLPLLLIEKIKHSLELSDFELGLLMGPAFATSYIIFAIPFGWMVDRWSRMVLLACSLIFWSAMTALAGFASGFSLLFVSRLGVGLAEACLSPCALSLIADRVPLNLRTRAVAIFQTGSTTGAFVAMAGGGTLVAALEGMPRMELPIVGVREVWQEAFLISACVGLLPAALLFMSRDRRAQSRREGDHVIAVPASGLKAYLAANLGPYSCLLVAGIGYTALGNLASWSVAVFSRVWHWDVARAGQVTGTLSLAGALLGALLAVRISGRRGAKAMPLPFDAIIVGLALSIFGISGFAQAPGEIAAAILYFLGLLGMACAVTGAMTTLTLTVPRHLRGQVTAIYFFCVTLVGVAVLQPLVGAISDRHGLPVAMTGCALAFGVPALMTAIRGRARSHAAIARQSELEAGAIAD